MAWKFNPPPQLKILGGFVLLLIGGILALPGVPGPGIAVILLGLWVLSDHFTWARRALAWLKEKTGRIMGTKSEDNCTNADVVNKSA